MTYRQFNVSQHGNETNPWHRFTFCEFFSGGGMARAGLGIHWHCKLANDIDPRKATTYLRNWKRPDIFLIRNIRDIWLAELPGQADLAWASFPCQDLSVAGRGGGLEGTRSSTFHVLFDHIRNLRDEGRAPAIVAIENVTGTLTSSGGLDFTRICERFHECGYAYGALVIDAALFVPQSRPRLFVIGVRKDIARSGFLPVRAGPGAFHTQSLQKAVSRLGSDLMANWVWWDIPEPPTRNIQLIDLIEADPTGVPWHSEQETRRLLETMNEVNLEKVHAAQGEGIPKVGAIYKRTRMDGSGRKVRAEVRFDGMAGCLRTPAGGSSRQTLLFVHGDGIRSRLLSAREGARLMGLPDSYQLPGSFTEAFHLTGDGVAVPVVRHLAKHLFEPILAHTAIRSDSHSPLRHR